MKTEQEKKNTRKKAFINKERRRVEGRVEEWVKKLKYTMYRLRLP